jgi:hypothetical protein
MTAESPVRRITVKTTMRLSRLLPLSLALLLGAALVAGCGGGGGDDSGTATASSGAGGGSSGGSGGGASGGGGAGGSGAGGGSSGPSWSISGTPPASVMQGTAVSFMPTVTNPNGVTLTFTYANLPSWATANSATGAVTGTPGPGDVGTYSNIELTVTDGTNTVAGGPYSIQVVAAALGSATLTWTPPTRNADGSPLTGLAGYKIYWGTSQSSLTNSVTLSNPGLTSYVVDQLTPATWYFAATATNSTGAESAFSNIASKTITN